MGGGLLIKVERLDDFAKTENIDFIDFLKIDAEGNELNILKGARRLLANKSIRCIQFEFGKINLYSKAFLKDFRKELKEYQLFRLLPHGLYKLPQNAIYCELFAYQNIIGVRS